MGRVKKSTRKFEKNHLKRSLDERKEKAKLKQQHQLREKKKKRRQQDRPEEDGNDNEPATAATSTDSKGPDPGIFENMSVEEFFQGGFEVPEALTKGKAKKKGKKEATEKRKRDQEDADDTVSDAAADLDEEEADELAMHKQDLEQLAKNDPEFYKYLKENDAELLEFTAAEKADLSEVDDLSDTDDKPKKKKKHKKQKEEDDEDMRDLEDESEKEEENLDTSVVVKMADVKKWRNALTKENSLRSLRQVVLAFRAAAHTNDATEGAGYKYAITSPEGMISLLFSHCPIFGIWWFPSWHQS